MNCKTYLQRTYKYVAKPHPVIPNNSIFSVYQRSYDKTNKIQEILKGI